MILTNPPFGGEEERGILGNFPEDKQTAETALLFLQLIMRKLRRPNPAAKAGPGRRRRAERHALRRRRLRPDQGRAADASSTCTPSSGCRTACSPRTPASRRTCCSSIAPARRRTSGTTSSRCRRAARSTPRRSRCQFEEFADCLAWWKKREENERAWKVPASELLANGCNLDRKNPHAKEDIEHLPPASLSIASKRKRLTSPRLSAKSRRCSRGERSDFLRTELRSDSEAQFAAVPSRPNGRRRPRWNAWYGDGPFHRERNLEYRFGRRLISSSKQGTSSTTSSSPGKGRLALSPQIWTGCSYRTNSQPTRSIMPKSIRII